MFFYIAMFSSGKSGHVKGAHAFAGLGFVLFGLGCWFNFDSYCLFLLQCAAWTSLTEAVINYFLSSFDNIEKMTGTEVKMESANRYIHIVLCVIWMVLGYWCQSAAWKFFWTLFMASCLSNATRYCYMNGKNSGNTTWYYVNMLVLSAITLNALIVNWIMGTTYPTLNFILVCVLVANMSYFNYVVFRKSVQDSGTIKP